MANRKLKIIEVTDAEGAVNVNSSEETATYKIEDSNRETTQTQTIWESWKRR